MRIPALTLLVVLSWAQASEDLRAQALPTLEPTARFGCLDCTGPHSFVSPQDIAVDADGRIFVLDTDAPMVRVFDSSGRTLLAFGRTGRGPREFQLPIHVGLHADGSFHVLDARLYRLTRFDRAGTELSTRTLAGFPLAATYSAEDDVLFLATTDFRAPTATISALDSRSEARTLLRLEPEFPRARDGSPSLFFDLVAAPHGGFTIGAGAFDYRVRHYDAAGGRTGETVREVPRSRRSQTEISRERERRERNRERVARMRTAEGGRSAARPGEPPIPEEKNHFDSRALGYDAKRRLWVHTQRGGISETIFDVFTPAGGYVGEVRLPVQVQRFALGPGVLAAIVINDDDVTEVVVWRVDG